MLFSTERCTCRSEIADCNELHCRQQWDVTICTELTKCDNLKQAITELLCSPQIQSQVRCSIYLSAANTLVTYTQSALMSAKIQTAEEALSFLHTLQIMEEAETKTFRSTKSQYQGQSTARPLALQTEVSTQNISYTRYRYL